MQTHLNAATLFWLDGHYSGGITGMGKHPSPIVTELQAILQHPVEDHVVLIDDARLFRGRGGFAEGTLT